jgi:hypothetical protein
MKKGDTVEVTTKVSVVFYPFVGKPEQIPPGTVFVGELVMNTTDAIKMNTDEGYRDFDRKSVRIKVIKGL